MTYDWEGVRTRRLRLVIMVATVTVIAVGLVLITTFAHAMTMVSVTGRCQKLFVGNKNYTKDCQPKLVNVSYPNGRLGFWFLLPKKSILSFSGPALPNPSPDTGESIIDQVVFQLGDASAPTSNDPAQGRCTYSNPVKPMTIRCQGTMPGGVRFTAIFRTDGRPPR